MALILTLDPPGPLLVTPTRAAARARSSSPTVSAPVLLGGLRAIARARSVAPVVVRGPIVATPVHVTAAGTARDPFVIRGVIVLTNPGAHARAKSTPPFVIPGPITLAAGRAAAVAVAGPPIVSAPEIATPAARSARARAGLGAVLAGVLLTPRAPARARSAAPVVVRGPVLVLGTRATARARSRGGTVVDVPIYARAAAVARVGGLLAGARLVPVRAAARGRTVLGELEAPVLLGNLRAAAAAATRPPVSPIGVLRATVRAVSRPPFLAGMAVPFDRNPMHGAPPEYPRLRLLEGDTSTVSDELVGIEAHTTAAVVCMVTADPRLIGTAATELYARVMSLLYRDRTLGGAVDSVREVSLEAHFGRSRYTAPIATLRLNLELAHTIPTGELLSRGRAHVFAALAARLAEPLPALEAVPRRELVFARVVTALAAGLPGVDVGRSPLRPVALEVGELAVRLVDGEHSVDAGTTGANRLALEVPLELYAAGADMDAASDAINLLADRVRAVLRADPRLGGLCHDLEERIAEGAIPPLEGQAPTIAIALAYEADLWVADEDVTSPPEWELAA